MGDIQVVFTEYLIQCVHERVQAFLDIYSSTWKEATKEGVKYRIINTYADDIILHMEYLGDFMNACNVDCKITQSFLNYSIKLNTCIQEYQKWLLDAPPIEEYISYRNDLISTIMELKRSLDTFIVSKHVKKRPKRKGVKAYMY